MYVHYIYIYIYIYMYLCIHTHAHIGMHFLSIRPIVRLWVFAFQGCSRCTVCRQDARWIRLKAMRNLGS